MGHGPAPSAASHWPNVGQCPAFFQKERQLHTLGPSRASRVLADPVTSLAERLKGSGCDWPLLEAGGRHAAGVHGPRGGRGPGGGARAQASGVLVWIFFFFSAKEVCFGHAPRLPPPPAPSSSAPGRTPLGADCKAPFLARSAKLSRARGSPTWCGRSARLCPLGTLSCKETAARSPTRPDYRILPGHSGVAPSCRGLADPRRALRICYVLIPESRSRAALPTPGHTRPNPSRGQVTGLASLRLSMSS